MSGDARWSEETKRAAQHLGFEVVETDGIGDYQGWGVHLLRSPTEWAVLKWDYGSCSGCDAYEDACPYDPTPEQAAAVFGDLVERCVSEDAARQLFADRKGW